MIGRTARQQPQPQRVRVQAHHSHGTWPQACQSSWLRDIKGCHAALRGRLWWCEPPDALQRDLERHHVSGDAACTGEDLGLLCREFHLGHHVTKLLFLLRRPALLDGATQPARMLSVKGHRKTLHQSRLMRIGNHHPHPGRGLEQRPLQPNRKRKGQHQKPLGRTPDHGRRLAQGRRPSQFISSGHAAPPSASHRAAPPCAACHGAGGGRTGDTSGWLCLRCR